MSVIVMGMDYPNHCFRCRFKHSGISDYCIIEDRDFDDEDFDALVRDDWHPEWCPLRPLPEKHGRLIDADALAEDLRFDVEMNARLLDEMDFVGKEREHIQQDKDCKQNCIYYIEETSTIVEAEGE